MKILANFIVLVSLFLSQLNFSAPVQAPIPSATDTGTPTAAQTPSPTDDATAEPVTPSETDTPKPPAESTAAPTLAVDNTATVISSVASATATETAVPTKELGITLTLSAVPEFILPNGKAMIIWNIEGLAANDFNPDVKDNSASIWTLQWAFPIGIRPIVDKGVNYDEPTRTLILPIAQDSGRVIIQAEQNVSTVIVTASLFNGQEKKAETSISLAAQEQFTIRKTGGMIQARNGKIKVRLPANIFSDDTLISIGSLNEAERPAHFLSSAIFEIKAQNKSDKVELYQFNQDIDIEVSYADLNIPEEEADELSLYWYNPATKNWEGILSGVDRETKTIKATINHFSVFDIGVNNWQANHVPTIDAFQVSQFTGAGTFSLPIEVPSSPGGLQPNLTLTYNSQVVDQSKYDPTAGSTNSTLASWVGMGWSLDTGSIERDIHGTPGGGDFASDDTYLLTVGGISTRLARGTDNRLGLTQLKESE